MQQRLIIETGLEARIAQIVEPIIENMGYVLVRVKLLEHNGLTVQIMAELSDGTMSVENCEQLSKALSPVLDVEDPIDCAYKLEISSPGIDRVLVRREDFAIWAGHYVNLETIENIENRKKFKGILLKLDERDNVIIRRTDDGKFENFSIALANLAKAKLVLTETLVRETLKREKINRHKNRQLQRQLRRGVKRKENNYGY